MDKSLEVKQYLVRPNLDSDEGRMLVEPGVGVRIYLLTPLSFHDLYVI